MYTNGKATIYNLHNVTYFRTILPNVFWTTGETVRVDSTGIKKQDAGTRIFVPFDSAYKEPTAWEELSDKTGAYTFRANSKDFIVQGECEWEFGHGHPITELLDTQKGKVIGITTVLPRLFGSPDMHHFELGGSL